MTENKELDIQRAQAGDSAALESMICQIQGQVYGLALRMLWHPEDAKDATQEILLRVVTHLASFRGESSFSSWVYRIAANHLSSWRKSTMEAHGFTFESFGEDLEIGLSDKSLRADEVLLFQEIRVGCTLGMLLCLDRPLRLAYILGEILDLDSVEAAEILGVNRSAFRKRLERGRAKIVKFMQERCGLVNSRNPCRCGRRVERAIAVKRVDPERLLYAHDLLNAKNFPHVLHEIRLLEEKQRVVAVFRSHPEYATPDFAAAIKNIIGLQEKSRQSS